MQNDVITIIGKGLSKITEAYKEENNTILIKAATVLGHKFRIKIKYLDSKGEKVYKVCYSGKRFDEIADRIKGGWS